MQIDAVYTWVTDDEKHIADRDYWRQGEPSPPAENGSNRYSDNGELRFSIRSIYAHAPWIRKIFIVVQDGQRPAFLADRLEDCKIPVELVNHSVIYGADYRHHLPTFNSQSIEVHLYKIPDLSEHFIYFNDDMFLGRSVSPFDFFASESFHPRYIFDGMISSGRPETMTMHNWAWYNNGKLLNSVFGPRKGNRAYPAHQAVPMLKSSFETCWQSPAVVKLLENTSRCRFRHASNIYFIGFLVYWNIYTKRCARGKLTQKYMNLRSSDALRSCLMEIKRMRPSLICLNDSFSHSTIDHKVRMKAMLQSLYPLPAPCEN